MFECGVGVREASDIINTIKVTFSPIFYVPVGKENGTHEISAQFGVETRLAVAPSCASDAHSTEPVLDADVE